MLDERGKHELIVGGLRTRKRIDFSIRLKVRFLSRLPDLGIDLCNVFAERYVRERDRFICGYEKPQSRAVIAAERKRAELLPFTVRIRKERNVPAVAHNADMHPLRALDRFNHGAGIKRIFHPVELDAACNATEIISGRHIVRHNNFIVRVSENKAVARLSGTRSACHGNIEA